MSDPPITLREADADDLDRIVRLLDDEGLPSRDVRAKPECFFVATAGPEFVGVGGLETFGSDGLLRSVAIAEAHRGEGYGSALCDALETHARSVGVDTLYLLTTTAAAFFRRRGYREVPREAVPASIGGTTEFTELCPSSATRLRTSLGAR